MQRRMLSVCLVSVVLALASGPAATASNLSFSAAMQAATDARHVPLPVIQAIAYVDSHWEMIDTPARNGGFGPMNVLPAQLDKAALLSGHTRAEIMHDPAANLDAGAALLADAQSGGTGLASWLPAVQTVQGNYVAAEVFDTLRLGATRTTSKGELISLGSQASAAPAAKAAIAATAIATTPGPDYPLATWVPASPSNYSTANRPHDYAINKIVIHDIEGSYGSAIQEFQNGATQASAHYVVSDQGQMAQMVNEHDIAWHAGNWDYNTHAIGIEHEGFAYTPGFYTPTMYQASAHIIASICSRWGVPMDRSHVIGHAEVPDPNHPGQFGGAGHHTDPGPYWDWNYYMGLAASYALALPSPPHMTVDPIAVYSAGVATVSWQPAQSCHDPITGYSVVGQPGNLVQNLPANATSATFNLPSGTNVAFTITVQNASGQDSRTTNSVPWALQVPLAGGPAGSSPTIASWSQDRMDIFYRGTDGQLYHQWSEGYPWRGPEALGGVLTSAPTAVSWGPSRIDVFARGLDQQLWHKYWNLTSWSNWEPLGGVITAAPTVASWGYGRLDIFARGQDNGLWHKSFNGYGWSQWQPLGGVLTAAPTAASWDLNRIDMFGRGTDQHLWHMWWDGAAWSNWQDLGGTLNSAPAVTTSQWNRLDVVALNPAGGLQHTYWNGVNWRGWRDVGAGQWSGDPAAMSRQPGWIDIVSLDPSSMLSQLQFRTF